MPDEGKDNIGKQRNSPVGSVKLMWNAESATYDLVVPNGE